MNSVFYDVNRTVEMNAKRSKFTASRILGISRSWYYRQLDLLPIVDKRFNPFEVKEEELRIPQHRYNHPKMGFRLRHTLRLIKKIAYLSPSEVYKY